MGSEENANLVRRGYAAFSTGDMATLSGLFADDAVWHVPGSGSLSGAKRGRDAILAFFGELFTRSGGTIKVTLHDVIGGDVPFSCVSRLDGATTFSTDEHQHRRKSRKQVRRLRIPAKEISIPI